MPRTLDIRIEIPEDASEEAVQTAAARGREAAVIVLQQEGELSISCAAGELGLSYERYLDLLAEKGLPASNADTDPEVIKRFIEAIERRRSEAA